MYYVFAMEKAASLQLADWIISRRPNDADLTQLKLQKLSFYCYGAALAFDITSLSNAIRFEPWEHGPANRLIWQEYTKYGKSRVPTQSAPNWDLSASDESHLNDVLTIYGRLSAWDLRDQSHLESPWIDAYKARASEIDPSELLKHFKQKFISNVRCPEYVLRANSYALDGVPTARYGSLHALATSLA